MRWYKKAEYDAPELNSPQPCAHGAGCDYKLRDKTTGEMTRGCCAFVHPGEEGTGRRLFEERVTKNEDGTEAILPACVRLTGRAGFYERRRLRLSWPAWCERQGIPYRANEPAAAAAPVEEETITPAMQRVIDAAVARALQNKTPPRSRASPKGPPRIQRARFLKEEDDGSHSPRLAAPPPPPIELGGLSGGCYGCDCSDGRGCEITEGLTEMETVD